MNGKRTDHDWPKHAGYASGRQYRAQKRAETRAALRALNALSYASAWMPAYQDIDVDPAASGSRKKAIGVWRWKR